MDDIIALVAKGYQPNCDLNAECATLMKKYGIDPEEVVTKDEWTPTPEGGQTLRQVKKKRYANPAQIYGGLAKRLETAMAKDPEIKKQALAAGIPEPVEVKPEPKPYRQVKGRDFN
ncbi:MAG TPA: hypothetical protein VFE47_15600 [Tepidisphaeraceae bacterium]|jgi:hypothetical protein|nr:hypothetical protein [Tepidisphaeraceae bacterium]